MATRPGASSAGGIDHHRIVIVIGTTGKRSATSASRGLAVEGVIDELRVRLDRELDAVGGLARPARGFCGARAPEGGCHLTLGGGERGEARGELGGDGALHALERGGRGRLGERERRGRGDERRAQREHHGRPREGAGHPPCPSPRRGEGLGVGFPGATGRRSSSPSDTATPSTKSAAATRSSCAIPGRAATFAGDCAGAGRPRSVSDTKPTRLPDPACTIFGSPRRRAPP